MLEKAAIIIGICILGLFMYRYVYLYLSKVSALLQKFYFMNKILSNASDIKTHQLVNTDFTPVIRRLIEKDVIKLEYLVNPTYKEVYEKYEILKNYKLEFWKFEGRIYVGILIGLIVFLEIGRVLI